MIPVSGDPQNILRAIVESLEGAITAYDGECRHIANTYGPTASTQPARDTLEATAEDLHSRYQDARNRATGFARRHLGAQRRAWAESRDYIAFNSALAAFAITLPLMSDEDLIARFRDAVTDPVPNDALALLELTKIRFPKPSAELADLQRQAFELGAEQRVQQATKLVAYVDDLIVRYDAARAEYESRVAA
jgi:hypothetical protein